jgi:hypothetical protein
LGVLEAVGVVRSRIENRLSGASIVDYNSTGAKPPAIRSNRKPASHNWSDRSFLARSKCGRVAQQKTNVASATEIVPSNSSSTTDELPRGQARASGAEPSVRNAADPPGNPRISRTLGFTGSFARLPTIGVSGQIDRQQGVNGSVMRKAVSIVFQSDDPLGLGAPKQID